MAGLTGQFNTEITTRELAEAIQNGSLSALYQPEVNLVSGELRAFELLVRWGHPTRGLLKAREFIELAEETGLVVELDRWVVSEACRQLRKWEVNYPMLASRVNVNMSPPTLDSNGLVQYVRDALAAHFVGRERLGVEITHRMTLSAVKDATSPPIRLHALGVGLGFDHFGQGMVGMTEIRRLPVDNVKFMVSFMILNDQNDRAIVESIQRMATGINIDMIATRIEEQTTVDALLELGVTWGQGHFVSPPLTSSDATKFLVAHGVAALSHLQ
jgi:Amt family ammonium transporter